MFETELINEIRERLSIFIGLYDRIRIVDPIKKELIKEEGVTRSLELHSCLLYTSPSPRDS